MTPEARLVLKFAASVVACAAAVLLALWLLDHLQVLWWTLGAVVALAVAVAYCWGWTERRRRYASAMRPVRVGMRTGRRCPCAQCSRHVSARPIRETPWWRVVLWGTGVKEGVR